MVFGSVILARKSRFSSPTMQRQKRNHALRKVQPCTCASPTMQVDAGAVLLARNSRFADDEVQIFARMSGMLDLSRDENAKHFLPR